MAGNINGLVTQGTPWFQLDMLVPADTAASNANIPAYSLLEQPLRE